ncbi:MAG: glycine--tRNA ligase subunit beta, partial [Betaproteobacteria bacterium]|nr:glycine--tRNA ligase subunit beta [Betaproteobacteria bacterium]
SWDAPQIAQAIEEHYRPRFAGDQLPESRIGICVALADKLDALVGLFGIGQVPTGEKDPFSQRRAALGVVRILIERSLPLDVMELLEAARRLAAGQLSADVSMELHAFFMDRLRPYLRERGYAPDEIDAVLALNPLRLDHVLARLDAVKRFRALPEGTALSAANKRIRNILRQAGADLGATGYELRQDGNVGIHRNSALLRENAERNLDHELESAIGEVRPMLQGRDYASALRRLAALRPAVDEFFDKVMVMVDDADLRNNRLALLKDLGNLFLQIADVSRLQG